VGVCYVDACMIKKFSEYKILSYSSAEIKFMVWFTLVLDHLLILLKFKVDQLEMDIFGSHLCNFHATHSCLIHVVNYVDIVTIDGSSYDKCDIDHFDPMLM